MRGGVGESYRGSDSSWRTHSQVARLTKNVASLLKVKTALLPVATSSEEVVDVGMDRKEWESGVGARCGNTNFDGYDQPVPNQGLQISMPISIEKYIEEGWNESRRFATLPQYDTLL